MSFADLQRRRQSSPEPGGWSAPSERREEVLPANLNPASIVALQRHVGNRATAAYLAAPPALHRKVRLHDESEQLPDTDKQLTVKVVGEDEKEYALACATTDKVLDLIKFVERELGARNVTKVVADEKAVGLTAPLDAAQYTVTTITRSPIPDHYKRFIEKEVGQGDAAAWARDQYAVNVNRAKGILAKLRTSVAKDELEQQPVPSQDGWNLTPKPDDSPTIRGFGLLIDYEHKTLMADHEHKVGYKSQIKSNTDGTLGLRANANYAPTASQREENSQLGDKKDPFLEKNLNGIWASQIAYYRSFAQKANKQAGNLRDITRSKVENPFSLASYWISGAYRPAGEESEVTDPNDLLAIAGSPNGNAALYLLLQTPEIVGSPTLPKIEDDGELLAAILGIKVSHTREATDFKITIKAPSSDK